MFFWCKDTTNSLSLQTFNITDSLPICPVTIASILCHAKYTINILVVMEYMWAKYDLDNMSNIDVDYGLVFPKLNELEFRYFLSVRCYNGISLCSRGDTLDVHSL